MTCNNEKVSVYSYISYIIILSKFFQQLVTSYTRLLHHKSFCSSVRYIPSMQSIPRSGYL